MYRIGNGYDVHRLVEGRKLILGGVEVPFELGLLGHSDADVLIHAIVDALFGALALGDIGMFFPDSDPKYKGANSCDLLEECYKIIDEKGYKISNIDSQIVAEKPKLKTYIKEIRINLAAILKCDIGQISVKATTEERLGFTGNLDGIKAYAVALLEKK